VSSALRGVSIENVRYAASRIPAQMDLEQTPLTVGLVTPGWPREAYANGIVSSLSVLAPALQSAGVNVVLLSTDGDPAACRGNVVLLPPPSSTIRSGRWLDGLRWRIRPELGEANRGAQRLDRALSRWRGTSPIDLIELEESFGWAGPLAQLVDIPIVVFLHGPWFIHGALQSRRLARQSRRRMRVEGTALRHAHGVLAPARDVLDRTTKYYGLRPPVWDVIPYATRPLPENRRWQLDGCDRNEVLFVGRFDAHKGGDILLRAFHHVLQAHPTARLVFAGPDRGFVDSRGKSWRVEQYAEQVVPGALGSGRLKLLGQRAPSEVEALRRHALVTVSCSRYENLSLAVLEAMAMGCPLVVGSLGGLTEHVRDGQSGRVFRAGDPQALGRCIVDLLRDPSAAAAMGRQALRHVEANLEPELIARRRIDYYRRVLRSHRSRSESGQARGEPIELAKTRAI
jgi:glycosyltransferase involved in cell wall biosynthesis